MSYERLKKKPVNITPKQEPLATDKQLPEETISTELAPVETSPIAEIENPFTTASEEPNAVEAIQATISPDPERLPMIANARNPRANAIGHTVSHYIANIAGNKKASIPELAAFAEDIVNTCMKHEIGQAGKENRTALYLKALEARMAFEQQQQLSKGDKAFGKT